MLNWILYWILRFALSLRYRIQIKGMDEIRKGPRKGILILPNHPAEVDPLILASVLMPGFHPRPLAAESFYYQKWLRFFMDLIKTLPLPSMDEVANPWKVRQIEKLKKKVQDGLKIGDNFLLYPSGRLKITAEEQVGGTSLVHDLLQEDSSIPMLLVRTSGLWGSRFSRALTGNSPDFGKMLLEGAKILLKNGIFFAPRRKVIVELEWANSNIPRKGSRLEINRAFEAWFNQNGPESLTLVSSAFWKEELPTISAAKPSLVHHQEIPQDIEQEVLDHLSKISRWPKDKIGLELSLSNDLGLDSLDVAQVYLFIEERFGISGLIPGQLQTVQEALQAAAGQLKALEKVQPSKKQSKWPKEQSRPRVEIASGKTLQEVFLRSCDRMGHAIACADAMTKPLSYQKLKRAALVLSLKIAEMEEEKIGVMLPASVAANVVVLAILLAGKVPVMLNWTAGTKSLEYAVKLCDLKQVISSYRFLSHLDAVNIGNVDDQLILLEELRRKISFYTKIKGAFLSLFPASILLKRSKAKAEDNAVVIFTSGTETLPKGVPLTHHNLLNNLRSAISCVHFQKDDILYGVLPPFHSFGFSVTGILPLLAGLKCCYSPDPTDSRHLAADIAHWKATLFCCAPSFILALLRAASPSQLESLRIVVTGAEKAPSSLFESFAKLHIEVLEGYGITECSPIVTLQREGESHRGVGKPIPGVEIKIHEDEVLIAGPNVFKGYLGDLPSPFVELEGKRWYRSGDRGTLEEDGTLVITGRSKRFVKIGGEMISLGGIEEELLNLAPKGDKPTLAVTATEKESEKPEIIVFATFDLTREDANQLLNQRGHSRLVKIAEVRRIQEIPLTGTGKTHYRLLEEMLKK